MSANGINVKATRALKTLKDSDYVIVGADNMDKPLKVTVADFKEVMETGSGGSGGSIEGTNYVFVQANGTPTENAVELQAAYDKAKTMSPSADNRLTVIAATGYYEFPNSSPFTMDTEYIDLVSLTGNEDVFLYTTSSESNLTTDNNIEVSVDNVFVKGVDANMGIWVDGKGTPTLTKGRFYIGDSLDNLVCEKCVGGDYSFGYVFTVSGTFTNCVGGNASFGSEGVASGTFTNCVGLDTSFGFDNIASGTFTNCVGGVSSFGGGAAVASGTFTDCIGGDSSFGSSNSTTPGKFINCVGGDYSFGYNGVVSGTFINCEGREGSFGKGDFGSLTGKLYYCILTTDTFQTVSGGGRTYYCVDGNGDPNNQ